MIADGWTLDGIAVRDDYAFCHRTKEWLKSHPKESAQIKKEEDENRG